jgi:hypothetical protein
MAKLPRSKFGPPSAKEMRRMRAEDVVRDSFRNSPEHEKMVRLAEKSMEGMEKEVRDGFKDVVRKAGGR